MVLMLLLLVYRPSTRRMDIREMYEVVMSAYGNGNQRCRRYETKKKRQYTMN